MGNGWGKSGKRFAKSNIIKLKKKYSAHSEILGKFGITRQAVHQLRKKYGIDSFAKNIERNQKIANAYKKGASGTALAKKYCISVSQTYRIINDSKKNKKKKSIKTKKK